MVLVSPKRVKWVWERVKSHSDSTFTAAGLGH